MVASHAKLQICQDETMKSRIPSVTAGDRLMPLIKYLDALTKPLGHIVSYQSGLLWANIRRPSLDVKLILRRDIHLTSL